MVTIIKKGTPKAKMKKIFKEACSNTPKKDIRKYAGVLQNDIDPVKYQKKVRNEWG